MRRSGAHRSLRRNPVEGVSGGEVMRGETDEGEDDGAVERGVSEGSLGGGRNGPSGLEVV